MATFPLLLHQPQPLPDLPAASLNNCRHEADGTRSIQVLQPFPKENLQLKGLLIPGGVQGQAGLGLEQPGLVGSVPAHGRKLEQTNLLNPFQSIL